MRGRWRRLVARFALVLTVMGTGMVVATPPASAATLQEAFLADSVVDRYYLTACGRYWPSSGSFETVYFDDVGYRAGLKFTLTQAQLDALRCVSGYLEIDFRLLGFTLPAQWDDYWISSTNLPGAIHDTAATDKANEVTPGVTKIPTAELKVNFQYYVYLNWDAAPPGTGQRMSVEWVPSYWADLNIDPVQKYFCDWSKNLGWSDAFCVFGRTRAFLSHGYTNATSLPFGAYQLWTFNSPQNSNTSVASAGDFPTIFPPPQTLTLTQGMSIWPGSTGKMYQPMRWSFTVKNTSGSPASIARLVVAVRAPDGSAHDVPCSSGGFGLTLQPNDTWTCDARLPQGYGSQGTYTYWADWMGHDGAWHHGQLGGDQTFTLGPAASLSASQTVSVGPSDRVAMYTPLQFSYRVKNTSGAAASIQRFSVAVRAPDGSNQDVPCQNGTGVTLQANQEWTCNAPLPQGYGSAGTFTFWADWEGYDGSWHKGQLGWDVTFTQYQGPTLTTVGPLSIGPSGNLAMYQPLRWSYRVKNTSGAWASIERFSVPVRGPNGDNLDVPCLNGDGVTLAPGQEWTCEARLSTGYGSQGTYTFWADWLAYDGSWHQGNLSNNLTFTLGPPNTLSSVPGHYLAISPGSTVAANASVTFTFQAKNTSGVPASIERFVVAVRGPNDEGLDVPCTGGNGVALAANAIFTCTASVPAGYATGVYTYWADWMDYNDVWHDGQLSDVHAFTVN